MDGNMLSQIIISLLEFTFIQSTYIIETLLSYRLFLANYLVVVSQFLLQVLSPLLLQRSSACVAPATQLLLGESIVKPAIRYSNFCFIRLVAIAAL